MLVAAAAVLFLPPGAIASAAGAGTCPAPGQAQQVQGPSDAAVTARSGSNAPRVRVVRYPRPDHRGTPWSQWGQGLVLPDGRYLSAIGDENGIGGNSYLFVYDPATGRLTRIGDVISHTDHVKGEGGYGKIHAHLVRGRCGQVYFATYWGSRRDLKYTDSYRGDLLFRLDPVTLEYQPLGVPVEEHGIPSLAGSAKHGLVYGEATDPFPKQDRGHDQGAFFAYDTTKDKVVFRSDDPTHTLFRDIMVDAKGRAYVAKEGGYLLMYAPGRKALQALDVRLPQGGALRASTRPAPDGTIYGVTQGKVADRDHELFAFSPANRTVRDLGAARGYTASIAISKDGSTLYYVPGAHGDSAKQGTPVIAVDTETGSQHVVTNLDPLSKQTLGLSLAGSYDVALDAARDRLFVGLNAGETDDDPWGEVVLAVVDLRS